MKARLIIVVVLLVAGGAFANYLRYSEQLPDHGPDFAVIPNVTEEFNGEEKRFSEESYAVLKADTTMLRLYYDHLGQGYWFFIAYFKSQKYGSQVHSPKNCLPGSGWRIDNLEPYLMTLADGSERNVNRLIIRTRGKRQLMFYWFETRGGTVREEFGLKWDLMMNSLLFRPSDAAFIRLNFPVGVDEDIDQATDRAIEFLNHFIGDINRALPFDDQKA